MDPFGKVFQAADPLLDVSDDELDTLVPAERILERIQRERLVRGRGRLRRSGRRAIVISTATVFVLAGTAAAISLLRSPVRDTSSLACYSQDSLRPKIIEVLGYGTKPLEVCSHAMHWRSSHSGQEGAGALCVLKDGTLGAFPPSRKGRICERLGLSVFNGKLKYPRVSKFESSVQSYFTKHQCVSRETAKKNVLELMSHFGLKAWHVNVGGSAAVGACATFGIDVDTQTAFIVGIKF